MCESDSARRGKRFIMPLKILEIALGGFLALIAGAATANSFEQTVLPPPTANRAEPETKGAQQRESTLLRSNLCQFCRAVQILIGLVFLRTHQAAICLAVPFQHCIQNAFTALQGGLEAADDLGPAEASQRAGRFGFLRSTTARINHSSFSRGSASRCGNPQMNW